MSPIILILGSGSNVGQHVARAFAARGYKVALASRKQKEDSKGEEATFSSDFSDPAAVVKLFAKVKATVGIPSVVVYNAAAATRNDPHDPLSLPLDDFTRDLTVNTTSAFVAAQQAAAGFSQLPDTSSRTFIYTGNALNTSATVVPPLMDLGVGKSATAHLINSAAAAYRDRGFKFYYADERNSDGSPASVKISGEAHAEAYVNLAEEAEQRPWCYTFVKGEGYKDFPVA